jgi:alanine racemase
MDSRHTLGIFEAGISMPGEMDNLAKVIQSDLGVMTNISDAHRENFASRFAIAKEKVKLFSGCSRIIWCADYPELTEAFGHSSFEDKEMITWGIAVPGHKRTFGIVRKTVEGGYTHVEASWKGKPVHFSMVFADPASVENAVTCIVTLLTLGYSQADIQERLSRLAPVQMRLEVLDGVNHSTLINDSYSSDIHSLDIALDFLKSNDGGKSRVVILSDMLQTGLMDHELYSEVNRMLEARLVEKVYCIGSSIADSAEVFSVPAKFYPAVQDFIREFDLREISQRAVLIKGARSYRFERITEFLQEKSHDTRLEVDLGALVHNLNYFRARLSESTRLMVMVKAFGYGSGAREIASILQFSNVDYLAVAYTDEGVELRKAGISIPVMVMNPEAGSLATLIRYRLEPELYSLRTVREFLHELAYHQEEEAYPVHIKIDSGMHRLGFVEEDLKELLAILKRETIIRVASVFTHLSSSENPEHDSFTRHQLSVFEGACSKIQKATGGTFLRHALNTGGIQRFPDAQYDMVRLGIGLYGVSSEPSEQAALRPVSTFLSHISQIKTIEKGDIVGYGMSYQATETRRIAVVPVGYADGLRRSLSNGKGFLMVRGQRAPILGRVCMDMTMIDISNIDCSEGDTVEIFGPSLALSEFATMSETIAYEVLTSISQRVKRIHTQE